MGRRGRLRGGGRRGGRGQRGGLAVSDCALEQRLEMVEIVLCEVPEAVQVRVEEQGLGAVRRGAFEKLGGVFNGLGVLGRARGVGFTVAEALA